MKNATLNSWVVAFAGMLLISGQAIGKDKSKALVPQPHPYVLEAPKNIDRWEPSAAVVIGDRLWVANDKPVKAGDRTWGVLAAYDLTAIKTWKQLRAACKKNKDLKEGKCDGNKPVDVAFIAGGNKIEAGALLKGDGVWWDTIGNKNVVCLGHKQELCAFDRLSRPSDKDLRKLVEAKAGVNPKDLEYVTVEALAVIGNQNWVGVRKYKKKSSEKEVYWTAIVDHKGALAWGGGKLALDGKLFAVSDLFADSDGLWVTLSYEKLGKDNDKREDVDGRLAWVELTDDGSLLSMRLCMDPNNASQPLVLAGKPEGIAVFGEKLAVVYDSDKDRKEGNPKDGNGFPIRSNQDYLELIQKPNCSAGPKLDTE
jgi:hypothetical protein